MRELPKYEKFVEILGDKISNKEEDWFHDRDKYKTVHDLANHIRTQKVVFEFADGGWNAYYGLVSLIPEDVKQELIAASNREYWPGPITELDFQKEFFIFADGNELTLFLNENELITEPGEEEYANWYIQEAKSWIK